ncbi:MAG: GNAT family N-acetyltransferase [Pseudomonadota bacterium]
MENSDIRFRPATLDDKSILDDFLQCIVAAERPMDECLKSSHIEYYNPIDFVASDNAHLIVAIDGEDVVGCGAAVIEQAKEYYHYDQFLHLAMMYVSDSYRGLGINGELIRLLLSWGSEKGMKNASLTVYPDNPSAIRAYEKLGFAPALIEMRLRNY